MATINDIITAVNNGKLLYVKRMAALSASLKAGFTSKGTDYIYALKRLIIALTFQINADLIDDNTLTLYKCLIKQLGGFGGNYTIDPSVKSGASVNVVSGPLILNKNETDLIFDAPTQQYYLPYLDNLGNVIPSGVVPVSTITTGVSFTFTFDTTFSPPRIFGFANNLPQSIVVTAI